MGLVIYVKKALNITWNILQVLIIIYVILITGFIFCENKYGFTEIGDYTFNNVSKLDTKNIKNVKAGDLLIVKNTNDLEAGDIVYYYAAYNEQYIIVSDKVVSKKKDRDTMIYTLNENDPFMVSDSRVIGKYTHNYRNLGKVLSVLESKNGFIFLVLLPIMIVFIYQVKQFLLLLRYEKLEELKEENGEVIDDEVL